MPRSVDRQSLIESDRSENTEIDVSSPYTAVSPETETSRENWKIFRSSLNSIVHTLIGASLFVTLWFAFKTTPITIFQLHICFNMIGYQLLMAHAILSLDSYNSWSSYLSIIHRRRAHWMLQLVGSVLAITGSILMMRQKSVNFNTIHGKLALAALVFTCASLVNGLTALYAAELRRFIPITLFKTSHTVIGITAFTLSTVCLAFGYNKSSFKKWASPEIAYIMIAVTCLYTLIIVFSPLSNVVKKISIVCKIKIF